MNNIQTAPAAEARTAPSNGAATSIVARMAEKLQVDPAKLWATMSKTCFKPDRDGMAFTSEEVMYVLMVAEQLDINPLRREIWAFRGKGGVIQPIVSIDGWKAIMLRQPNFDGYQVTYSESTVEISGIGKVPEWAECTIWLKGVSHPTTERVFMSEVFVPSSPVWNKSPRLMLHHRALIQAIRFSFPVTGISDVGVTEEGDVIEGDDFMNGRTHPRAASAPQVRRTVPKPVTFDAAKAEEIARKTIGMARKRRNYGPALEFAEAQLEGEVKEYVLKRLREARETDERAAIDTAQALPEGISESATEAARA